MKTKTALLEKAESLLLASAETLVDARKAKNELDRVRLVKLARKQAEEADAILSTLWDAE